ncbi:RHS repeat-associated core domain-containing protein [Xenorhabdus bovienii]|uniref:RHS repeat-associated core domain-containing protein n=1 Tax=Xenorhabdus bovienii TaxID=40576 RepID=UPI003DA4EE13
MSDFIYSNAFNFSTYVNGGVDLRTGQYGMTIHLTTLRSHFNPHLSRDISLSFSMMNTTDTGFGTGWSLHNSEYYDSTVKPQPTVYLSSGEQYQVEPSNDSNGYIAFKDKKLKDAYIRKIHGRQIGIVYKIGMAETLTRMADGKPFQLTRLHFENGEWFDFHYNPENPDVLASITDAHGTALLRLTSHDNHTIDTAYVRMAEDRESRIDFSYVNNRLVTVSLPTEGDGPAPHTVFSYQALGELLAISMVSHPTGSRDNLYYQQAGHRVGELSQTGYLPYVIQWDRFPGGGQPIVRMKYRYSPDKNFTGYPFNGSPSRVADNLYLMPGDYAYWAMEIAWTEGKALRLHQVTYNKFHLPEDDLQIEKSCETRVATHYNALPDRDFFAQPANLQIPQRIVTTYTTPAGKSRSETLTQASDEEGNITERVDTRGVKTTTDYYPATGEGRRCPADPLDRFRRYIRTTTVTPAGGEGRVKTTEYAYQCQPARHRINFLPDYVVVPRKRVTNGRLITAFFYEEHENNNPHLNGLLSSSTKTLTGKDPKTSKTTIKIFSYTLDKGLLTTAETTRGFDGGQMTESKTVNIYTGRLESHTDAEGTTETQAYDTLGRLVKKVSAAGSPYETVKHCRYRWPGAAGEPAALEVMDGWGVSGRTEYDGFGREIATWVQDSDGEFDAAGHYQGTFRKVASSAYDSLGRLATETKFDYADGQQVSVSQQTYAYDGWGQVAEISHNTGLTEHCVFDPVAMTKTQSQGDSYGQKLASTCTTYNLFRQPARVEVWEGSQLYSTTVFQYDGFGRKIKTTQPGGATSTVDHYDVFDRPTRLTDFDGTVHRMQYSDLTEEVVPAAIDVEVDGHPVNIGTQVFDGLGRLTGLQVNQVNKQYEYAESVAWPSAITNGRQQRVKVTTLPELGQVASVHTEAPENENARDEFTYSTVNTPGMPSGILLSSGNAAGRHDYHYARTGRLTAVKQTVGTAAKNMEYHRQTLGGTVLKMGLDARVLSRELDSFGRVITTTEGDITTRCTYDTFGRLQHLAVEQAGMPVQQTEIGYDACNREISRIITTRDDSLRLTSQYDPQNRLTDRTRLTRAGKTLHEIFRYDNRNRLVSYVIASGYEAVLLPCNERGRPLTGQAFHYDGLNNLIRLETTFANGEKDVATLSYAVQRLTEIRHTLTVGDNASPAVVSVDYDADGNLTALHADGVKALTLAYSATSRLIRCGEAAYGYDAGGKLIQRGGKAQYYLDGEVASEESDAGELKFIRHGDISVAEISTESRFLMTDKQGSVIGVQDAAGTQYVAYTPLGASASQKIRTGFNGVLSDPDSGGYLLGQGVRLYLPALGGFTAMDSLSPFQAGELNPYRYCHGDPVNLSDPSGYMSTGEIIGDVVGLLGAAIGIGLAIPTGGASLTVMAALDIGLGLADLAVTGTSLGLGLSGYDKASRITSMISGAFGLASVGASSVSRLLGNWAETGVAERYMIGDLSEGITDGPQRDPWRVYKKYKSTFNSPDTYILATERAKRPRDLERPINYILSQDPELRHPIYILSGTQGTRVGNNWTAAGLRDPRLVNDKLFHEDAWSVTINWHQPDIKIRNLGRMTKARFQRYLTATDKHIILAFGYGRYDRELESYLSRQTSVYIMST